MSSPQGIPGIITKVLKKGIVINSELRWIYIPYTMIHSVQYANTFCFLFLQNSIAKTSHGDIQFTALTEFNPEDGWDHSFQSSPGRYWKKPTYVLPVLQEVPAIPKFDRLVFLTRYQDHIPSSSIQEELLTARNKKVIIVYD
ncbi:hypothetical protein P9F83_07465 [Peribacillus psychrosaccharolyticus]|uniref:hypothetical protein n=1 Tax=Peribacillus psychrosaccharolyticus TaxID=1407 RepID=UPI000590149C|nr:hypothetical protein [Peribacillus psychrosaccharolyticus]MEC2055064.1 hypothetical protein [Peribacillus psychrosaccharolyticus]MED3743884.1 hypothetical protein [Peribacillus psychrosaccharolyticus]